MRNSVGLAAVLVSNGAPRAQDLRSSPPLPKFPQVYETSEQKIRVDLLAEGLANPWSIAFLPDGALLITERAGRLRIFRDGKLDPQPIAGTPEVKITVLGGLLEVLLHPRFADNRLLYLSYAKAGQENFSTTAIARARFEGTKLTDVREIFVANSWSNSPTNFGGRMVFGRDGKLYVTIGERQEQDRAQDRISAARCCASTRTAPCRPTTRSSASRSETGDLFARSPQPAGARGASGHGRALGERARSARRRRDQHRAARAQLWLAARDVRQELRRRAGQRRDIAGRSRIPVHVLGALDRDLGAQFYTGDRFPAWKGNAFVGSMMHGRIRWTGHVERLTFNDKGLPITASRS